MHFVSLAMTFASSVILLFDVTNHVPQTKQNKRKTTMEIAKLLHKTLNI